MLYRARLVTLFAMIFGVMCTPSGSVFAQDIESAKTNCDVETLVHWAWGNSDRVTELEHDVSPDCLIAVTDSGTTVTDTIEEGNQRLALGSSSRIYYKNVEELGIDAYSTYTQLSWSTNSSATRTSRSPG